MTGRFHISDAMQLVSFGGQAVQTFNSEVGFMDKVRDFEPRNDDIIITSYPKSGTHWILDIVGKLLYGLDEKTLAEKKQVTSLEITPHPKLVAVERNMGRRVSARLTDSEKIPCSERRLYGSHLWYTNLPKQVQEGKGKLIYIWRNPKDVAVSGFHLMPFVFSTCPGNNVPEKIEWNDYLEQYLYEPVMMGSWWDHVKNFYNNKSATNMLFLCYEDLKKDTPQGIRQIADHLEIPVSEETVAAIAESCGFEATKKRNPDNVMVRKGIVGGWKNHFTVDQNERFDRVMARQMAGWEDRIKIQYELQE